MTDAIGSGYVQSPSLQTPTTPATWKAGSRGGQLKNEVSAAAAMGTPTPLKPPNQTKSAVSTSNQPAAAVPPPTPTLVVPTMPSWKKDSLTPELDAEVRFVRVLVY